MYIFGGNDIRMGMMNNLWSLDLSSIGDLSEVQNNNSASFIPTNGDTLEWKLVQTHGKIPGKSIL